MIDFLDFLQVCLIHTYEKEPLGRDSFTVQKIFAMIFPRKNRWKKSTKKNPSHVGWRNSSLPQRMIQILRMGADIITGRRYGLLDWVFHIVSTDTGVS